MASKTILVTQVCLSVSGHVAPAVSQTKVATGRSRGQKRAVAAAASGRVMMLAVTVVILFPVWISLSVTVPLSSVKTTQHSDQLFENPNTAN